MKKIFMLATLLVFTGCAMRQLSPEGILVIQDMQKNQKASFEYVLYDTTEEKKQGLSNLESMQEGTAALFALEKQDSAMWMKDMMFPLDILFFDDKFRLISTQLSLDPCVENERCTLFNIPRKAKWALEINGGVAASLELGLGDNLSL